MHFDGKMKNNRRKIERGLGILPYGNSTTQTIGKCGGFRLCHDTGSACYGCFRHSRRVCRYFNVGEKRWWVFFLNDKNRIQYNDQCKKCVYECKQSFRCCLLSLRSGLNWSWYVPTPYYNFAGNCNQHHTHIHIKSVCVKRLTCFSCRMLWTWYWECIAHHHWDKIAPD